MSRLAVLMIVVYQKLVSPFKGPTCRFFPTCSQYALEAFSKYGFCKGVYLSVKRVLCCHPLHPGGYDPLI